MGLSYDVVIAQVQEVMGFQTFGAKRRKKQLFV